MRPYVLLRYVSNRTISLSLYSARYPNCVLLRSLSNDISSIYSARYRTIPGGASEYGTCANRRESRVLLRRHRWREHDCPSGPKHHLSKTSSLCVFLQIYESTFLLEKKNFPNLSCMFSVVITGCLFDVSTLVF